jgi:hypothetical protein
MIMVLALLIGCQSESKEEKLYQSGLQLMNTKKYPQAIGILTDLGSYKNSKQFVSELRYIVNGNYIGAGNALITAIKSDGTVIHSGGYEDSKSTRDWNNVMELSTHGEYIEGLNINGVISTTCPWTYEELQSSTVGSTSVMSFVVNEMPKLEHVTSFQSDYPRNVTALLDNGKVKIINPYLNEEDIATVNIWEGIVAVADNGSLVLGLKADGSVVIAGERYERYEVSEWKDIVAISTAISTIGLREDGTVVAAGDNRFGEGDVEDWTDIIAIATGGNHTIGLKGDGTVIATGDNSLGQCDIEAWTDIIAIDTSEFYTIGLKSNGTLMLAGNNSDVGAKAPDVLNMSGLLVPTIPKN